MNPSIRLSLEGVDETYEVSITLSFLFLEVLFQIS